MTPDLQETRGDRPRRLLLLLLLAVLGRLAALALCRQHLRQLVHRGDGGERLQQLRDHPADMGLAAPAPPVQALLGMELESLPEIQETPSLVPARDRGGNGGSPLSPARRVGSGSLALLGSGGGLVVIVGVVVLAVTFTVASVEVDALLSPDLLRQPLRKDESLPAGDIAGRTNSRGGRPSVDAGVGSGVCCCSCLRGLLRCSPGGVVGGRIEPGPGQSLRLLQGLEETVLVYFAGACG
ncbi:hypothetical protein ABW21_db0201562 [Orbilia brochopaga]|nr:hypothetical protein ABW21_db0201562 [Drechslerella brochopaga]